MHQTSMRRVLGLPAVGAIALSTAVLPIGAGTAHAEPAAAGTAAAGTVWSVSTDNPAGLTPLNGGGFTVTVPLDVCAVDWTVIGGQGGAGSAAAAGAGGGELRVTAQRTAGQTFQLHAGPAGQDWTAGATGGENGIGGNGQPGTSDGAGGGGGGGGAASAVRFAGTNLLVAHGGDGGGTTGGAGGSAHPGPSGNTVTPTSGDTVPLDTTFDGGTSEPGGAARNGAGVVSGVGVPCPESPPGAPSLQRATTGPEDGLVFLGFRPATPTASQVWSPVTGWQVTVDGGATWAALPTTARPDGFQDATLRGLANADHQVAVRATSAAGPGAPSALRSVRLVGTPIGVTVTAGVSSLRVSWTPPPGVLRDGYAAESYDAAQDGLGVPSSMCETTLAQPSCVLAAQPGKSYRVVVMASGGRPSAPVTSGVVAAPPVPAELPASSGALRATSGAAGPLKAGDAVRLSGSGYLPRSTVSVVVYSTPTVLASLITDENGSFDTTVTLPAGLPAGAHTLVAAGVAPDGRPWTLTQAITAGTAGASAAGGSATGGAVAGGLAYTGSDVAVPAIGGLVALIVGGGLSLVGRRRRIAE